MFVQSVEHKGGEIGFVFHPDFPRPGVRDRGGQAALLRLGFERFRACTG